MSHCKGCGIKSRPLERPERSRGQTAGGEGVPDHWTGSGPKGRPLEGVGFHGQTRWTG